MGFHDHYSGVDKVYLLHRKSDAAMAIKKYIAWARSYGVDVYRLHTDNAPEFHVPAVQSLCADKSIRLTSCAPNEPRGNGIMERRWRIMGNDTREGLHRSKCPPSHWWFFLRNAVVTSNMIPGGDRVAPWTKFTGHKPDARAIRSPGCLTYYKVVKPASKMHPRARRALNYGRCEDQPGYCLYDLENGTLHITPHCRFVESCHPGLGRASARGEPTADDVFPSNETWAPLPADSFESDATQATQAPELDTAGEASGGDEDDDDGLQGAAAQPQPPGTGLISSRLATRVRRPHQPHNAATFSITVPEQGGYYLYIGSGPSRPGSLSEAMASIKEAPVVNIDLKVGGYAHDLHSPPVIARLRQLASDPRCLGVLGSVPCRTWSTARARPADGPLANSRPVRDCNHKLGFKGADGKVPDHVLKANWTADLLAELCSRAHAHNASFIVETAPSRGSEAAFPLPGRERHVGMLEHPSFEALADSTGALTMHFDQCMTRDDPTTTPVKKTVLLFSSAIAPAITEHFTHLMCNHPSGSHLSMVGMEEGGQEARSQRWENYSEDLNLRLARCLSWKPPVDTAAASALNLGQDPMHDWQTFYSQAYSSWFDDGPARAPTAASPLAFVASIAGRLGRAFSSRVYDTCVDGQCFAAPHVVDPDSPSLRQAMNGPERAEWEDAREKEFQSLRAHGALADVLEDTLPTWNATKQRAYEVVNLLDVLKKEYIDGVFDKFKARWVYDGAQQKRANAVAEHPLDTYAPTARHSTHKCLVSTAVMRGAAPTTLSSAAYIRRITPEVLPRPLSEYPSVHTPCNGSIHADYVAALEARADVDAALLDSYPRKAGKLVYTMPASRVDAAYAIGVCTRCLRFPSAAMDANVNTCMAYLAQRPDLGPTYDKSAPGGTGLVGYVDSDWCVERSTTGFCIMYGGAVVSYGSKRQECIALSSTEAEIMAASQAATEIMYVRGLLGEMGVPMDEPTVLYVDNSGAVELSKDLKACKRSRHIERRYLKVRELVAQGHIVVKYKPTADNHADVLTKPLPRDVHERHVSALLNFTNGTPPTPMPSPAVRQRTFDVEAAYLKGTFADGEVHYARPPPGYRVFERGVPVVWQLKVPLYGEADAGRIWNRTLVKQLVEVQKFKQSKYDPCYFWKFLADGTRMDMVMYVDDGYVIDAQSALADAELEALNKAFTITIKPAHFFLGNNIIVHDGAQVGAP